MVLWTQRLERETALKRGSMHRPSVAAAETDIVEVVPGAGAGGSFRIEVHAPRSATATTARSRPRSRWVACGRRSNERPTSPD